MAHLCCLTACRGAGEGVGDGISCEAAEAEGQRREECG